MDAMEAIYKRRSIRKYADKKLEKDKVIKLLTAATAAPSAKNHQPWEFIVVDEDKRLSLLKEKLIYGKYNAPTAIVVCGNMKLTMEGPSQEMWVQDCSAAIENMMIAATSMGLGSVWIGIYPIKDRIEHLKNVLNIPEHVTPLGIVYVGYPAEEKEARAKFDESRVHWQEYDSESKIEQK